MMKSRRFGSRRGARFGAARPTRMWAGVQDQFAFANVSGTSTSVLVQLQAPADLSNLTSDPPEDLTVLRLMGSFSILLSAAGIWTLALLKQDVTWTPGATFGVDADKRVLWSQTFRNGSSVSMTRNEGGQVIYDAAGSPTVIESTREQNTIDVKPMVKIEAGQALYLVAYEDGGSANLTVLSENMRLLVQRTQRRR